MEYFTSGEARGGETGPRHPFSHFRLLLDKRELVLRLNELT